jgi:hypothetical protein
VLATSAGDGIFWLLRIQPGSYTLPLTRPGRQVVRRPVVELHADEVLSIEVHLPTLPLGNVAALPRALAEVLGEGSYHELIRRPGCKWRRGGAEGRECAAGVGEL